MALSITENKHFCLFSVIQSLSTCRMIFEIFRSINLIPFVQVYGIPLNVTDFTKKNHLPNRHNVSSHPTIPKSKWQEKRNKNHRTQNKHFLPRYLQYWGLIETKNYTKTVECAARHICHASTPSQNKRSLGTIANSTMHLQLLRVIIIEDRPGWYLILITI